MEKIACFKNIIQEEIERFAKRKPVNRPEIEYQFIMDELRNHFILISMGWHDEEYFHNWIFHLQIKGDKIWIHEDLTDVSIARILVDRGIPKSQIVLGFVPEYERELSEFAMA